jgi:exopolysaccharide biosynthesis predicted pyruvyltransferase EpsI
MPVVASRSSSTNISWTKAPFGRPLHKAEPLREHTACLDAVSRELKRKLGDLLADTCFWRRGYVFVNPANHSNIGDNLIALGTLALLLGAGKDARVTTCMLWQGGACMCRADLSNHKAGSLAVFGGNWGDVWGGDFTRKRIGSMRAALRRNMTVLSMPQSLWYESAQAASDDAAHLRRAVLETGANRVRIVLLWRQHDSLAKALELYPFADNRIVPDVTPAMGPLRTARTPVVDVMFLLRTDKEAKSVQRSAQGRLPNRLQSQLRAANMSWATGDWQKKGTWPKRTGEETNHNVSMAARTHTTSYGVRQGASIGTR